MDRSTTERQRTQALPADDADEGPMSLLGTNVVLHRNHSLFRVLLQLSGGDRVEAVLALRHAEGLGQVSLLDAVVVDYDPVHRQGGPQR